MSLQGNVDPVVLFGSQAAIEEAVKDCLTKVSPGRPPAALRHAG